MRAVFAVVAVLVATIAATTTTATADHHKSLADCTAFDQQDKGDASVEMTVHNSCSVPVDCDVTWTVTCAPDTKKRKSTHPSAVKLTIGEGLSQTAEASAAVCGDDSWEISSVNWSCQANKD